MEYGCDGAAAAEVTDDDPLGLELSHHRLHGDPVEASKLLTPYSGPVNLRAVSRHVSNVNNEGPECLDDAEPSWGSQQSLL